jgi:hypothetical protein
VTRTRKGTIYALIDPRDQKIRYIGKTEKPILARLAGHLATPTNPAMRVWINALSLQGLTPRIESVTTVPVARLDAEEKRQIEWHAAHGHRLLNAPHYHQHLADLGQQPTEPLQHPPLPAGDLAQMVFGELAAARARGQVPAWVAGLLVATTAPLYLTAVIVRGAGRALLNTTAGVAVTVLGLGAWVLWDAGFDHAVRDLLLPHLPTADWRSLWEIYAADQLATLAEGLVWPYVGASLLLAGMSYTELAEAAGVKRRA